jgi:hypothetical protein
VTFDTLIAECLRTLAAGGSLIYLSLGDRKGKDLDDPVRLLGRRGPVGRVVSASDGVVTASFDAETLLLWLLMHTASPAEVQP